MGIDILDVAFRLERRFGVRLGRDRFISLFSNHTPPDVTAGELLAHIRGQPPYAGVLDGELDAEALWPLLQECLSDALGVDRDEITKETFLIRDLGMN